MKHVAFLVAILFALVIVANAQVTASGSTVENFVLPDLDGKVQTLNKLKGRKGTVVVFLSAQCPVVNAYKDRINRMSDEAATKGINFIGINSNATESIKWVKSNAMSSGYNFPVLIDKDNKLADKLDVRFAPEVYFLNGENVLLYQGAIDNEYSGRNVTERYLLTAMETSLAGRSIARTVAPAFGCSLRRGKV